MAYIDFRAPGSPGSPDGGLLAPVFPELPPEDGLTSLASPTHVFGSPHCAAALGMFASPPSAQLGSRVGLSLAADTPISRKLAGNVFSPSSPPRSGSTAVTRPVAGVDLHSSGLQQLQQWAGAGQGPEHDSMLDPPAALLANISSMLATSEQVRRGRAAHIP